MSGSETGLRSDALTTSEAEGRLEVEARLSHRGKSSIRLLGVTWSVTSARNTLGGVGTEN